MPVIAFIVYPAKNAINEAFKGREPWEIVGVTSTTILAAVWFYNFIFQDESIVERSKKTAMNLIKRIPAVRDKIESESQRLSKQFEEATLKRTKSLTYTLNLPEKPIDSKEIVKLVERHISLGDFDWDKGRVSGCVYHANTELKKLITEVYGMASYTNPLHPDVFPGICKMEAEIVRMVCRLFGGNDETCGSMTSGGTESILLACKAYRDYARETKGITKPEMVIPVTAHAAFDKAAQYLRIKVRYVPINPDSYTVSIAAIRRAINGNTIMLACSVPNFPYGTMDNVEAIAHLGEKYNIPVHVDACLGGFLVCFMKAAGYPLPEFDFRLKGVTSISADTHKYGYAPKGTSLILYRNKKFRHHQYTITTDWLGGLYGSPTVNGSRAGGLIAACWATMMYYGFDGYVEATRKVIDTAKFIEQELRQMDGIYVMGSPATSVIAFASSDFHIFNLCDGLHEKGWSLNTLQFPSAIHICVTHVHTQPGVAQQFVNDVKSELAKMMKDKPKIIEGMSLVQPESGDDIDGLRMKRGCHETSHVQKNQSSYGCLQTRRIPIC
ncbi:hypothetical protein QAD02_017575 [Eretmocerus hayati]|uniref:Uncharacterized protein n=1 Tax=Eretmocerus hayati TaxID=131215 RepID=A0ACC2PFF9_9HYME|nr:hypothetical protein QAD02_017575 [Eretmocerus hayati]